MIIMTLGEVFWLLVGTAVLLAVGAFAPMPLVRLRREQRERQE